MSFKKNLLKSFPFIKQTKGIFLAIDRRFKIIWAREDIENYCGFSFKEIMGKPLETLIRPIPGRSLERIRRQISELKQFTPDQFIIRIKPDAHFDKLGGALAWRLSNLASLKATADVFPLPGGRKLLHIHLLPYEIEHRVGEFYNDCILITDENFRIMDFNENAYMKLYNSLKGKDLVGLPVRKLLMPGVWEEYQRNFINPPKSRPEAASVKWTTPVKYDSSIPLKHDFIFEIPGSWRLREGFLEHIRINEYSYALLDFPVPFHNHNVRFQCNAYISPRQGLAMLFGVFNNSNLRYLETSGYYAGVQDGNLLLKKAAVDLMIQPLNADALKGETTISVNLMDNRLQIELNGRLMMDYPDPALLDMSGKRYCGFATSGRAAVREFSISTQKIPERKINIYADPADVRFAAFPEELYKLQFHRALYYRMPVNILHFKPLEAVKPIRDENVRLQKKLDSLTRPHPVGRTPVMKKIFDLVESFSPSHANVLILGDTGTGKEEIARLIHEKSTRHDKPFTKIDCAAIPPQLLESELFGHEKGSFTGAYQQKKGRFEVANGGTVFLDEIGNLPMDIQVKLLRVIQDQAFERVGGTETIKTNVRIIAATNINMENALKENTFRDDLYYRIAVFTIHLPPLREHKDDIPLLVRHFLDIFTAQNKKGIIGVERNILRALESYDWPGNIRELRNAVERAVILCPGDSLRVDDLPPHIVEQAPGTLRNPLLRMNKPDFAELSEKQQKILSCFQEKSGEKITVRALAIKTGYAYRTLQFNLDKLLKKNFLLRHGKGAGVVYESRTGKPL